MPKNAARAYAEWHDADTKAREAESRLKAAWLAYDREDEAPPAELLAEVSMLRSIANDKLKAAVEALSGSTSRKG